MTVDLHVHTTASDGSLTPFQVIEKASEIGLKAIAITDHDTVSGIAEGIKAAHEFKIKFVSGVELSCDFNGHEVHILGYFLNYRDPFLQNKLNVLQKERHERALKIIDKIAKLGFYVSYEKVKEHVSGSSVGRVHIAQALIECGYFNNIQQVFESLLGRNCPGYVSRKKLVPSEAINILKRVKGVPVLAHPGFLPGMDVVEDVIKQGIVGLEVHYPAHEPHTVQQLLQLAKKHNLVITGGSDFHGEHKGPYLGQSVVDVKVVEELYNLRG